MRVLRECETFLVGEPNKVPKNFLQLGIVVEQLWHGDQILSEVSISESALTLHDGGLIINGVLHYTEFDDLRQRQRAFISWGLEGY